jgi:hypothetical protein
MRENVPEKVVWRFYGYQTPALGRDVQEWFDSLLEVEREEALDVAAYLQLTPRHLWGKPHFEPFDADISEIRFKVGVLKRIYRIYGAFWPEGKRYCYTFLLGKNKKVDNDRRGRNEAIERLKRLRRREATVHEFEFEKKPDRENQTEQGSSKTVH